MNGVQKTLGTLVGLSLAGFLAVKGMNAVSEKDIRDIYSGIAEVKSERQQGTHSDQASYLHDRINSLKNDKSYNVGSNVIAKLEASLEDAERTASTNKVYTIPKSLTDRNPVLKYFN